MAQWNVIGHGLFASEPIGNLFYLLEVIFEISKWFFIIKPPVFWGVDVSIEIYELLLLFSIISSCSKKASFAEDPLLPKLLCIHEGGRTRWWFVRVHRQTTFEKRYCCHKRNYLKTMGWNGENFFERYKNIGKTQSP